MSTARSILAALALAALCLLLGFATYGVWIITGVVEQLPERLDAAVIETRGALLGEVADTRAEVLKHLDRLERRADSRLTSIQADVNSQLTRTIDKADSQLAGTLARIDAALGEVHGIREELTPTLGNVQRITAHADEATAILFRRDALPAQILGLTAASKVAAGEVAQTMRVVRDSAPQVSASTIATAKSINGIAADVHVATSEYVKARTFWQKVWAGFKTAGILYVRTL